MTQIVVMGGYWPLGDGPSDFLAGVTYVPKNIKPVVDDSVQARWHIKCDKRVACVSFIKWGERSACRSLYENEVYITGVDVDKELLEIGIYELPAFNITQETLVKVVNIVLCAIGANDFVMRSDLSIVSVLGTSYGPWSVA